MKIRIVITLCFFSFIQNINAQININPVDVIPTPLENRRDVFKSMEYSPKGMYFKDINGHFDKFIGTWEYDRSDKYLKIQFYKVEKILHIDNFYDMLFSFLEYREKQNGQWITVYNTFTTEPVTVFNYEVHDTGIEGGRIINSNFIFLNYTEPTDGDCRDFDGYLDLKYQGGSPSQLMWKRSFLTPTYDDCDNIDESDFKIPANLVLTKITNP